MQTFYKYEIDCILLFNRKYTIGFILTSVLAWTFKNYHFNLNTLNCNSDCQSHVAVDRISFGFVIYHSLLSLVFIGVKNTADIRAGLHNGWWPLKTLIWAALMVAMFYIQPIFFSKYYIATFVFSVLFILLQSLLLVDFAWNWSADWMEKWESGNGSMYKGLLLFLTACFYLSTLIITILLYFYYTPPNPGIIQLNIRLWCQSFFHHF